MSDPSDPSNTEGPDHASSKALVHHDPQSKILFPKLNCTSGEDQDTSHNSTEPQTFHPFMMLPAELRIMIWKLAAGPRFKEILEIKPLDSEDPLPQGGKLAVFKVKMDVTRMKVAQACYEAWEIIRGPLKISAWPHTPMQTYMDPHLDSLMIHSDIDLDAFWMSPDCLIGNARHLILDADEYFALDILDDIPASRKIKSGFLSSVETISVVVVTFRIPAKVADLYRERFSTQVPFVIDIDDIGQIAWMTLALYVAMKSLSMSIAFIEECLDNRQYWTTFPSGITQRIQVNLAAANVQDGKIPDIKRVMLILDETDKRSDVQLMDEEWAMTFFANQVLYGNVLI
ncbi:uncharacterized protein F4807DRAFT_287973 [Annulohypoxylon truncatum]|uniref:uncharacterized protein n=1 Tax=Annulohypoxylon truncatum TaxID=327061 RepID=UPI0020079398|nr:uncharacterized protein F4807DRAFT_287973 [Annulohypoxylon truncatum]KAI1205318.1 hypothetical protein F4807DRAFT_287973 [Annulohypoxylon truncatum]